ncbi:hypothetical protein ACLMJK_004387 [Lecanora helva]
MTESADSGIPENASWKKEIQLAEGQDSSSVLNKLETLLADNTDNHRWYLCQEGRGIQRSFHFKTFKQTWDFMQAVAEKCKVERHHPEWWNAYNQTFIQWTTHRPKGLTIKDVNMAAFCDQQAAEYDEMAAKAPATKSIFGLFEAEI